MTKTQTSPSWMLCYKLNASDGNRGNIGKYKLFTLLSLINVETNNILVDFS